MTEAKDKTRNERVREALKTLTQLPEGRALIDELFHKCEHGKESLLVAGDTDTTISRIGRQSVANWLAGLTEYRPQTK